MDKDKRNLQMEINTRVNTLWENHMERGSTPGLMEIHIKVSFLKAQDQVMAF